MSQEKSRTHGTAGRKSCRSANSLTGESTHVLVGHGGCEVETTQAIAGDISSPVVKFGNQCMSKPRDFGISPGLKSGMKAGHPLVHLMRRWRVLLQ